MYAPMLATPFKGLDVRPHLEDPDCLMQQKFNGNRLLGVWRPSAQYVQFLTRNGTVYTKAVPTGLRNLPRPSWDNHTDTLILDGELVGGMWHVFDFLFIRFGNEHDGSPYVARRLYLEEVLAKYGYHSNLRLVPEARTTQDKALFLEQALERKAEGVVIKRAGGSYWFGRRSNDWLKIKFERTACVVIHSVRQKGKESAEMVMRDDDSPGRVVFVGDVSILGKEKRGEIVPGMVAEVKYLYATDDHILYQPRILRIRDDKTPGECTVDQLVYTDRGALVR